jgi:septum formation protein
VIISGFDEDTITQTNPSELVQALATAKAESVSSAMARRALSGDALVLGCDSMLELGGAVLGKPGTPEEAIARWQQMRGNTGVLHTGHSLLELSDDAVIASAEQVASTTVQFAEVSDAEIEAYVATGEPLQVAGAFTIDGLGGWFIERIEGDHHNVVGVSLPVLRTMLAQLGYTVSDLPSTATDRD